ncbi:Peptidase M23 [uncultured delta proteobacterium]|uniref:Peptidase M23 n=1 Tax=uncultured delta proteobacterium TaxID=34034 RepID=A0A212JWK8_9DELT|nr:Peptidase M23 [uncultured delta proteobacterium]
MLFKNYQIVVFKDRIGSCGHMRVSGWLISVLLLLLVGLTGAVAYLWSFYPKSLSAEYQLSEAERTIQSQNAQIVAMSSKLQSLQEDMRRVQQFDAKLRVMMNVDREPADTSGLAEKAADASSLSNIPLYRQDLLAKRMHSLADDLSGDVRLEEIKQQEILLALRENREFMVMTPSIWPAEGHLTSGFGYRVNPFTGQSVLHAGLDIANRVGTPIVTPARGTIVSVGWQNAYGNCVVINHGNAITTRYAHMEKTTVKEGQVVNRGDLIGTVGNTGRSTGPHLHYEVRVGGVPVNPMRYILN